MPAGFPPQHKFSLARTLRTLSFWAILVVGSIALVRYASSQRQRSMDISYTQFTEQLDRGNVSAVEIAARVLRGDFQSPVAHGQRTGEHFTTVLPFDASDSWVATLREKGVDVRAREQKRSFAVFVFSFLPYLFILALIIFMLRQMKQHGNRAFSFENLQGREMPPHGLVLAECQHAGSDSGTARSCPTCAGSGYVRVIPGPDGQPRRCQHAGSDNNSPKQCPTCYGSGWAGLVTGTG
jgi:hypothetical protein